MIKFEKVSYEQFKKAYIELNCIADTTNNIDDEYIKEIYNNIQIPTRATAGSAGYDFKMPYDLSIEKNYCYIIPTGIRAIFPQNVVLKIYPRSGLGFKNGLKLLNTVGIIDSDYCCSDNEGHIMIKITHEEGKYKIVLKQGDGFAQGVIGYYLTTDDDCATGIRDGGFGSTDKDNIKC